MSADEETNAVRQLAEEIGYERVREIIATLMRLENIEEEMMDCYQYGKRG